MESVSFKCFPTEDGKLNPESPRSMLLAVKARKGIPIVVTLEDWKETRTTRQNKFWWSVIIKAFCEYMGHRFNSKPERDFVHEQVLLACGHYDLKKGLDGKEVQVAKHTHNMEKRAFVELCETAQEVGAAYGVPVPDVDPIFREADKKKK